MKRLAAAGLALVFLGAAAPLTAEQDHQRLLDLMHIKTLRPGVTPTSANYDEAKAGPSSPLPDPLKLKDGKPVTTTDMWWQQRRQEITDDYEAQVYGPLSAVAPIPVWKITGTAPERVAAVNAVTRQLTGHAVNKAGASVDIRMTVTLPANAKTPVPVILQLMPGPAKSRIASTWREQVLKRGWGAAVLDVDSVQPDDGADLAKGIIGLTLEGRPRGLYDWGVLRAWAWGASRAMDYFESDPAIDSGHVGIAGHGRYGTAALIAMAYDPRYVVAYISSSGVGGAAPFRRSYGERIENLAAADSYFRFDASFLQYSGPKTADDLTVDSDELFALCAPRAVFVGAGDRWSDPRGMFLAEVAAGGVYRLLGKRDLGTKVMPKAGTALTTGELAFRQHAGGDTPEPNWPVFLAYAQRYLSPKKK